MTETVEKQVLTTPKAVIEALGGTANVAKITNRSVGAASNWLGFERFPANTYLALKAALDERGIEAPSSLWGMTLPADEREAAAQ